MWKLHGGRLTGAPGVSVIVMSAEASWGVQVVWRGVGEGEGALTSDRELAVELRVHLFVPLVAPHLVHGLPHHRHGHHEALSGDIRAQSQSIIFFFVISKAKVEALTLREAVNRGLKKLFFQAF